MQPFEPSNIDECGSDGPHRWPWCYLEPGHNGLHESADFLWADGQAVPDLKVRPVFTCPRCQAVSANPNDIREGYCGRCHDWTRDG